MRNITSLACLLSVLLHALPQVCVSQDGMAQPGTRLKSIAAQDIAAFKQRGYVTYRDFGALGDGHTDDIAAIVATHDFANQQGLAVRADDHASYYIGGKKRTAMIGTHTDFGSATFIIDDRNVEDRSASVFMVISGQQPFIPKGITRLRENQPSIPVKLPGKCLLTVINTRAKQYIRFGPNQNDGAPMTDILLVEEDGTIDPNTPVLWNFDTITRISALPIDDTVLQLRGGRFITLANQEKSQYAYYSRNIAIRRSRVVVSGLEHHIMGEGEHGAPYGGFIHIGDCAYITINNCLLTGHKTYTTIGSAGRPVSMGSYDLLVNQAVHVSFVQCRQTNDINDKTYWGVMASNYSKNLLYDSCRLSRFDAHKGVYNATIRHSSLGHMGIQAIGKGQLRIENSTIYSRSILNFRNDYGSTWQGELTITNCVFVPDNGRGTAASLITGSNSGQHDFGYTCYMPGRILIDNLQILDIAHPDDYRGVAILGNFNRDMQDASYQEAYPYQKTREIITRNISTASGVPIRLSDNAFMFSGVSWKKE